MSVDIPPYLDGVPMNAPALGKVTKADTIHSGENQKSMKQDSKAPGRHHWDTAAQVAGVSAGVALWWWLRPGKWDLPGPTLAVGSAFKDAAFVPDAPLSNVQNAQRAVHREMYPGSVSIAGNPQVKGVDWGQSRGEFRGLDSTYKAPVSLTKPSGASWFDFGGTSGVTSDSYGATNREGSYYY